MLFEFYVKGRLFATPVANADHLWDNKGIFDFFFLILAPDSAAVSAEWASSVTWKAPFAPLPTPLDGGCFTSCSLNNEKEGSTVEQRDKRPIFERPLDLSIVCSTTLRRTSGLSLGSRVLHGSFATATSKD